jgi:hypothetical protein
MNGNANANNGDHGNPEDGLEGILLSSNDTQGSLTGIHLVPSIGMATATTTEGRVLHQHPQTSSLVGEDGHNSSIVSHDHIHYNSNSNRHYGHATTVDFMQKLQNQPKPSLPPPPPPPEDDDKEDWFSFGSFDCVAAGMTRTHSSSPQRQRKRIDTHHHPSGDATTDEQHSNNNNDNDDDAASHKCNSEASFDSSTEETSQEDGGHGGSNHHSSSRQNRRTTAAAPQNLALHDLCDEASHPDDVTWRNALFLLSMEPHLAHIVDDNGNDNNNDDCPCIWWLPPQPMPPCCNCWYRHIPRPSIVVMITD